MVLGLDQKEPLPIKVSPGVELINILVDVVVFCECDQLVIVVGSECKGHTPQVNSLLDHRSCFN